MASKYGETHDIFNQHHLDTKSKLDSILAKNAEIDLNTDTLEAKMDTGNASHASIDGKITACNTGSVVVSSSALPAGAATESSLSALNGKVVAANTGACVVASSALPAGAASESSLSALNGKVVAANTGACVIASSALPAGAASESSLSALNGKVVAANTGACVVSSSALPAGAAVSAKQDEVKTLITATNAALAGTLTVSAPALSKSASTPVSAEPVNGQSAFTSAEIDISASRHFSLVGNSSDIEHSHEVDVLVSNVSGGTFFETSHSGFYLAGNFHMLVSHHAYKYVKVKVKNSDAAAGNSADFTLHFLQSN